MLQKYKVIHYNIPTGNTLAYNKYTMYSKDFYTNIVQQKSWMPVPHDNTPPQVCSGQNMQNKYFVVYLSSISVFTIKFDKTKGLYFSKLYVFFRKLCFIWT